MSDEADGDLRPGDEPTTGSEPATAHEVPAPSAPWERPARWPAVTPDEADREPSLAQLMSEITASMPAAGSRRRRREAEDRAAAAGESVDTVSASDLIKAFGGGSAEPAEPAEPAADTSEKDAAEEGAADSPEPETAEPEAAEPDAAAVDTLATSVDATGPEPESDDARPGNTAPDTSQTGTPPMQSPPDRPRRSWWVVGRVVIAVIALIALAVAGTKWVMDANQQSPGHSGTGPANIDGSDTDSGSDNGNAGNAPVSDNAQPVNILLLGLDAGQSTNADEGDGDDQPADSASSQADEPSTDQSVTDQSVTDDDAPETTTASAFDYHRATMLTVLHVSADRSRIDTVSIPADLLVDAPTCKAWDYQSNTLSDEDYSSPYAQWKISDTYAVGGSACSVTAVEQLSDLTIDNVVTIGQDALADTVDALGGLTVDVCTPAESDTTTAATDQTPSHLDGEQVVATLSPSAQGSDHPTLDAASSMRQWQVVIGAALQTVFTSGVLADPQQVSDMMSALDAPQGLPSVLPSDTISADDITLYSLPTTMDSDDSTVVDVPHAAKLWAALAHDQVPGPGSIPSRTPLPVTTHLTATVTTTPDKPQTVTVAPGDVDLQIVNVTGRSGVATRAMNALQPIGFHLEHSDLLLPPGEVHHGITVEYAAAGRAAALTVAAAVPGAVLVETDGLGTQVRLMLGEVFEGTVSDVTVGDALPSSLSSAPKPVTSTVVSTFVTTPEASAVTDAAQPVTAANPGCLR